MTAQEAVQTLLDGVDLRELNLRELRRSVGVVFEDTLLFNDTVSANIAFARPDVGADVIERAARLAGAHDFVLQLPEGYDTTLGERGYSLSGGQRQAVSVARAQLFGSKVIILDEPTAALGVRESNQVLKMIEGLRDRGLPIILISHNMPQVFEVADRIHVQRLGSRAAVVTPQTHSMNDAVAIMTGALKVPEAEQQLSPVRVPATA